MKIQEMQVFKWFKGKYGLKDFKFALREFKPRAIIQNDKRYKVVAIYPEKIEGLYFAVYNKKPVKETGYSDSIYGSPTAEHSVK
jgi:hypothetical protein